MRWFVAPLLALVAASPQSVGQPQAAPPVGQRAGIALVIGNSAYYKDAALPTVDNDRRTIAKALESQHFRVMEVSNLQRPRDFEDALQTLLLDSEAANEDTLVVYYTGHGVQIDGKARLVGTGISRSPTSTTLREFSLDVDILIRKMEQASPAARVLIIDACRNNPFAATERNAGVAFQRSTENTFIIFADEPGKTVPARSETSLQGPFTAALLYAFENSDGGLEARFKIARDKTVELNPGQTPQLNVSDATAGRRMAFIDYGGRAEPTRSAERLLDEAERYYNDRTWPAFRDKIESARVLAGEAALKARLASESEFVNAVLAAIKAEQDPKSPRWAEAAESWQRASVRFPARSWVLERAAVAWLMADRVKEGVEALARLQTLADSPVAARAARMLGELTRYDPVLDKLAKTAAASAALPGGPEFEKYVGKQ